MTPSIDRTLHQFLTITDLDLLPNLTLYLIVQGFHRTYANGCGMPTEDAYSSGHLVLSHFGTCICSNVETNLSWTCLVSGPLNFEHPSVLLFYFFDFFIFVFYFSPGPPSISPMGNITALAGSNTKLHCPAIGQPPPATTWSVPVSVFCIHREAHHIQQFVCMLDY